MLQVVQSKLDLELATSTYSDESTSHLSLLSDTFEQVIKADHLNDKIDSTTFRTADSLSVTYDLPLKLRFDWNISDAAFYTLLNNVVVKGIVSYVYVTASDKVSITGPIASSSNSTKIGKTKSIGYFSAAYYVDVIAAEIKLNSQPGCQYVLKATDQNLSSKPGKRSYTMTKTFLPVDGEPLPPGLLTYSKTTTTADATDKTVANNVMAKNLR